MDMKLKRYFVSGLLGLPLFAFAQSVSNHLDRYADQVLVVEENQLSDFSFRAVGVGEPADLAADEYIVGNCLDEMTGWSVPLGTPTTKVAIGVNTTLAESYKGDVLTKIRFYFYTAYGRGIENPKVFLTLDNGGSPSLDPVFELELNADELLDGWNEVTLDEPYTITGEKFYIGWQGIPADGAAPFATTRESFFATNEADDCWYYEGSWLSSTSYGKVMVRGVVKDENAEGGDMILVSMQPKLYVGNEDSYELRYKYSLLGDKEVTKYTLRYWIDDVQRQDIYVDMSLNGDENNRVIKPGDTGINTVLIPNDLSEGEHTFKVELIPDGFEDIDASNNVGEKTFHMNPEYKEELVRYSTDLENMNSIGMSAADGQPKMVKGAIMLPASRMNEYLEGKGEISMIRFYTQKNYDRWIKDVKVFITKDLFEEPLYVQDVDSVIETGWNEVYLDTPFKVTDGDSIYIGWECLSQWGGAPVIFDQTGPLKYGSFFGVGEADGSYQEWAENVGYGALYLEAYMYTKNVPDYNVQLMNFYVQPYSKVGNDMNVSTYIVNEGPERIDSLFLTCTVGNNAPVDLKVDQMTLMSGRYVAIDFDMPVESAENPIEKVTLEAKLIGVEDYDESDNTVESSTRIYETSVPRTVLIEEFTSQDCVSCLSAVYAINEAIAGHEDNAVLVAHHTGSFPDDFSVETSYNLLWFFESTGGPYNPAVMTDRYYISGIAEVAPVYASGLLTADVFADLLANPCFVSLDIKGQYEKESRTLDLTVSGQTVEELLGNNVVLNVWLVEDGLEAYQSTNGSVIEDYLHNNVMRFSLTDRDHGEQVDLTTGSFSMDFEFVIPETVTALDQNYEETDRVTYVIPENMRVVAFLSNYDMNDPMNCEVYNTVQVALPNLKSSVEDATAAADINVFAVGDKLIFNGDYDFADIYSVAGAAMMHVAGESTADISGLATGVYLVKIHQGDEVQIVKFAVK